VIEIVPDELVQVLVGRERDCTDGKLVIELNFESGLLPSPLCNIPTTSTPPFRPFFPEPRTACENRDRGLELNELKGAGTTTVVWERCFVALLGEGGLDARDELGVAPLMKFVHS
jgi:hypothetical protein